MFCAIRRIIADRLFRCFIAPTLKVLCIERLISGDTIAVTYHAHAPKKPYAARRPGAADKGGWGVSDGLPHYGNTPRPRATRSEEADCSGQGKSGGLPTTETQHAHTPRAAESRPGKRPKGSWGMGNAFHLPVFTIFVVFGGSGGSISSTAIATERKRALVQQKEKHPVLSDSSVLYFGKKFTH